MDMTTDDHFKVAIAAVTSRHRIDNPSTQPTEVQRRRTPDFFYEDGNGDPVGYWMWFRPAEILLAKASSFLADPDAVVYTFIPPDAIVPPAPVPLASVPPVSQ